MQVSWPALKERLLQQIRHLLFRSDIFIKRTKSKAEELPVLYYLLVKLWCTDLFTPEYQPVGDFAEDRHGSGVGVLFHVADQLPNSIGVTFVKKVQLR